MRIHDDNIDVIAALFYTLAARCSCGRAVACYLSPLLGLLFAAAAAAGGCAVAASVVVRGLEAACGPALAGAIAAT